MSLHTVDIFGNKRKEKYLHPLTPGNKALFPRTKLIEDNDAVSHWDNDETYWQDRPPLPQQDAVITDNGKLLTINDHHHNFVPYNCNPFLLEDPRPKFHVAAKSFGIPEPPKLFSWRDQHHPEGQLSHLPTEPSISEEEKRRKLLQMERDELAQEFFELQYRCKTAYDEVRSNYAAVDNFAREIKNAQASLPTLQKKLESLQKERKEIHHQYERAVRQYDATMRKPMDLRMENRKMRQDLFDLEEEFGERREELRKLKSLEGEGEYVAEYRRIIESHEQIDKEILNLAENREELQEVLEKVSQGMSAHIPDLMKTNGHIFRCVDMRNFAPGKEMNNNEDPSCQHGTGDNEERVMSAVDKAKQRRLQIRQMLKEMERKLSQSKFSGLFMSRNGGRDSIEQDPINGGDSFFKHPLSNRNSCSSHGTTVYVTPEYLIDPTEYYASAENRN